MTPQVHDFALRVATAIRDACAAAAYGTASTDERGDRYKDAEKQRMAASRIRRVDLAAIVAGIAEEVPTPAERDAFIAAARPALYDCTLTAGGEFYYPMTARAFTLWQAGVRRGLNDRSPAPQDKAETGVAAD
jgi:hypothetical protein